MKQLKILLDRKVLMFIRRFRCAATIRIFTQGGCYDITGPVADTRGYVPWSLYKKSEPLNSKRITTQCIFIV